MEKTSKYIGKRLIIFYIFFSAFPIFAELPLLPEGLGTLKEYQKATKKKTWLEEKEIDLQGFVDTAFGRRIESAIGQKNASLAELRLHLDASKSFEKFDGELAADFLFDALESHKSVDLDKGKGFIDLRKAFISWQGTKDLDFKLGRQAITWGTGDLLFINDLFPKDWKSFFLGRDEEYLKAPCDALKASFFSNVVNVDCVLSPVFDSDRFIDGTRLSYYNASLGQISGREQTIQTKKPSNFLSNPEFAIRIHRLFASYECALYGYRGYWKSPSGQDLASGRYLFPGLESFGASLRGPLFTGIVSIESGYYKSLDKADSSLLPKSEWRFLLAYEKELFTKLSATVQYYLEQMQEYGLYQAAMSPALKDKNRHVFTTRLNKSLLQEKLLISLFNYYSPSSEDGYVRLLAKYKPDDHWIVSTGLNVFYGKEQSSFFRQFQANNNCYLSLRYGF